jgi:hypothetical protein
MTLASEKYIAVTTFRKSGQEVTTPTWVTDLGDGKVGFWTSSASGKAKRLRNNPAVRLVASDGRGKIKPGAAAQTGTVDLVTSGPEFDVIQRQIKAKYGLMVPISRLFNTLGHLGRRYPYGDTGVVVTLD